MGYIQSKTKEGKIYNSEKKNIEKEKQTMKRTVKCTKKVCAIYAKKYLFETITVNFINGEKKKKRRE